MRYVYSLLAALACVVAILARAFAWPGAVIVVKQVQLWFRHVGHDEAHSMVNKLTTGH